MFIGLFLLLASPAMALSIPSGNVISYCGGLVVLPENNPQGYFQATWGNNIGASSSSAAYLNNAPYTIPLNKTITCVCAHYFAANGGPVGQIVAATGWGAGAWTNVTDTSLVNPVYQAGSKATASTGVLGSNAVNATWDTPINFQLAVGSSTFVLGFDNSQTQISNGYFLCKVQ